MRFTVQEALTSSWPWLLERLEYHPTDAFTAIEAVDSAGRIRGMIGYDRWTPGSAEMHCVVEHPAAWLALLGPGLQYPFEQAFGKGVDLVYAPVRDDNLACKRFLSRLGWTMSHRMRGGWDQSLDILVFELRKRDWYALRESGRAVVGKLHRERERRAA